MGGTAVRGGPGVVYLHIGAPKTGTTFLQTLLWDHREPLRERYGVLFPGDTYDEHFFAGVDLQDGCFHGDPRPESRGAWERLARQARQWPGVCIVSHEVFAGAGPGHARRAVADLAPAQVHVVYTARDLARQLPSRWQEDVKHGATDHFTQWWDAVRQRDDQHPFARWFYGTDDLPDVIRRWGGAVGPDRFHLVTVPGRGAPNVLWERFCAVVGLDPSSVDLDRSTISNRSLGVAEVEVVRRVNEHLDGALSSAVHQHVVKGVLGHDTLTRYPASRRVALPVEHLPTVRRTAGAWLREIEASGIEVVGELADIVPPAEPPADGRPGSTTAQELADAAVWALAETLLRLEEERLAHRRELEVAQAHASLLRRVRRRVGARTRWRRLRRRWAARGRTGG